jgi:hypothetical protein
MEPLWKLSMVVTGSNALVVAVPPHEVGMRGSSCSSVGWMSNRSGSWRLVTRGTASVAGYAFGRN